jgi:hypothetical protein
MKMKMEWEMNENILCLYEKREKKIKKQTKKKLWDELGMN